MNQEQNRISATPARSSEDETRTCSLRVDGDGIVRVVVKPDAIIGLADAEENVAAAKRVGGADKMLVLVDMRPLRSMSREARQFMAGEAVARIARAQALFVDSGFSKVVGNFLLGLNKPPYPTKMFTSERSALEWLKGQSE